MSKKRTSFKSTRRDILKSIAASVALGPLSLEAAQHVHKAAAEVKRKANGTYKPALFNEHEFKTVSRLAEMIFPADDVSGSAVDAGAPEFIDLIASHNEEMRTVVLGGLNWLDRAMNRRHSTNFIQATAEQQVAMLDLIAFRKNSTPELATGIRFFSWLRRLTADAFYTSPIGVKDVGYMGNKGMTTFQVPVEAINYAMKRSPFA